MTFAEVSSPIDLRQMADAQEWADEAMVKRPWRVEFFAEFAEQLAMNNARQVLELGSGPGFLAKHLLKALPDITYTALDFSSAMHALASQRIAEECERVRFVERSFRDRSWMDDLGPFDHVVTHQAVHEVRHKRHARTLHEQVRGLLGPGGRYLVCDHFAGPGGMANDQLYMTLEEQRTALEDAGFAYVEPIFLKRGLMLYAAS